MIPSFVPRLRKTISGHLAWLERHSFQVGLWLTVFLGLLQFVLHYLFVTMAVKTSGDWDWLKISFLPASSLVLLLLGYLISQRWTLRILNPLFLLWSAWFVTAIFYYQYYNTVLTIPLTWELIRGLGAGTGGVAHVLSVTGLYVFGLVAFALGLLVLSVWLSRRVESRRRLHWAVPIVAALVPLVLPIQLTSSLNLSDSYKYERQQLLKDMGLAWYLVYDFIRTGNASHKVPADPSFVTHPQGFPYGYVASRPPRYVVVVQVESLDGALVDRRINGKEITPRLNALARSSFYFPNAFANHSVGSLDADYSALTGLLPMDNVITYNLNLVHVPALPKYLKARGFGSYFFHPLQGFFFNMQQAYAQLGVDRYYHYDDYQGLAKDWYSRDREFFGQSLAYMDTIARDKARALFYLITMQMHSPFSSHTNTLLAKDEVAALVAKHGDDAQRVSDYFNAAHETDAAIHWFLGELAKRPWWGEAVVFIYGDHTAKIDTPLYSSHGGYHKSVHPVPLFVVAPWRSGWRIETPVSHIDVAPTVARLLGDAPHPKWLGTSLFESGKPLLLNNGASGPGWGRPLYVKDDGAVEIGTRRRVAPAGYTNLPERVLHERAQQYSRGWFYQ